MATNAKRQSLYAMCFVLIVMGGGLAATRGITGPATAAVCIGSVVLGLVGAALLLYSDIRERQRPGFIVEEADVVGWAIDIGDGIAAFEFQWDLITIGNRELGKILRRGTYDLQLPYHIRVFVPDHFLHGVISEHKEGLQPNASPLNDLGPDLALIPSEKVINLAAKGRSRRRLENFG